MVAVTDERGNISGHWQFQFSELSYTTPQNSSRRAVTFSVTRPVFYPGKPRGNPGLDVVFGLISGANDAAELKLRAERRAGEMLATMEKNKGGRPPETEDIVSAVSAPRLADIGIEQKQSQRWQKIASLPEQEFEQHICDVRESGRELTTASDPPSYLFTFTVTRLELYAICGFCSCF